MKADDFDELDAILDDPQAIAELRATLCEDDQDLLDAMAWGRGIWRARPAQDESEPQEPVRCPECGRTR